jgi:hypothetical protein
MAKKQKRQVARSVPANAPAAPAARPVTKSTIGSSFPRSSAATEFNPDYTYVVKDLKRIGITFGSFIVALVILSFFLK